MSKKLRKVIIIAVAFVVLLVVYFAAINPLLTDTTEDEDEIPELLPGEVLGINNRIMLFEHVTKAEINSIEVHNDHGTYTFYRNGDNFYIKDMETTPYDSELLSALVVSTGYTLSLARVDLDDMSDDMSTYGLAESDNPAYYILTKLDGTTHKVFVGDLIPTGGGYYCMYEGRKAVYVLSLDLEDSVLADVHTMLSPTLGYAVTSTSYYELDDFMISKNGKMFVWIDMVPASESGKADGTPNFVLRYPEGYTLQLTTYAAMMELFSDFTGDYVVAAGKELFDGEELNIKEKYGIDTEAPYLMLHYYINDIHTYLLSSEPDENGGVYVYSPLFSSVSYISNIYDKNSKGNFISWSIIKYVNENIVFEKINDIAKIAISGNDGEGNETDVFFTLEGEGDDMKVKLNGTGEAYDADRLKNFRQIYADILNILIIDYVDEGYENTKKDTAKIQIVLDDGTEYNFEFFAYSTRRCFYTTNGKGEFYVQRDKVEKVIRDTCRFIRGEQISSSNKT